MIHNQEKKVLKLLPCGATKAQIFEMYPYESDKYLRKLMQSIQVENNPHIPEEFAKKRQRLTRKELEKVIDVMGTPRGYENRYKD
jgi:hypothetical protein